MSGCPEGDLAHRPKRCRVWNIHFGNRKQASEDLVGNAEQSEVQKAEAERDATGKTPVGHPRFRLELTDLGLSRHLRLFGAFRFASDSASVQPFHRNSPEIGEAQTGVAFPCCRCRSNAVEAAEALKPQYTRTCIRRVIGMQLSAWTVLQTAFVAATTALPVAARNIGRRHRDQRENAL